MKDERNRGILHGARVYGCNAKIEMLVIGGGGGGDRGSINDLASDLQRLQEENARLKELNRALVEAIKLNCKTCGDYMCETCACYKALVKAREEKGQPPGIVVGYNFKKGEGAEK